MSNLYAFVARSWLDQSQETDIIIPKIQLLFYAAIQTPSLGIFLMPLIIMWKPEERGEKSRKPEEQGVRKHAQMQQGKGNLSRRGFRESLLVGGDDSSRLCHRNSFPFFPENLFRPLQYHLKSFSSLCRILAKSLNAECLDLVLNILPTTA